MDQIRELGISVLGHSNQTTDEDQLRRLAAIGLMTPNLAHDINNILQSVASVLRMIERRCAYGSAAELASLVTDGLRGVDRATTLFRRLMAYGRPGLSIQSRVSVNDLLNDLEPLMRWALGPSVTLKLSLDDRPLEVWCDPYDLENAVMNLAINARDAMPDGGLLAIETFHGELHHDLPRLPSGDYAIITASDTGEGMSADVVSRAFDPFFTTKASGTGFGMGLASVKAFVDASGGGADIVSRPSSGATVRLYLPLTPPAEPEVRWAD